MVGLSVIDVNDYFIDLWKNEFKSFYVVVVDGLEVVDEEVLFNYLNYFYCLNYKCI